MFQLFSGNNLTSNAGVVRLPKWIWNPDLKVTSRNKEVGLGTRLQVQGGADNGWQGGGAWPGQLAGDQVTWKRTYTIPTIAPKRGKESSSCWNVVPVQICNLGLHPIDCASKNLYWMMFRPKNCHKDIFAFVQRKIESLLYNSLLPDGLAG